LKIAQPFKTGLSRSGDQVPKGRPKSYTSISEHNVGREPLRALFQPPKARVLRTRRATLNLRSGPKAFRLPVASIRRPAEWLGERKRPSTLAPSRDTNPLWPQTKGGGLARIPQSEYGRARRPVAPSAARCSCEPAADADVRAPFNPHSGQRTSPSAARCSWEPAADPETRVPVPHSAIRLPHLECSTIHDPRTQDSS